MEILVRLHRIHEEAIGFEIKGDKAANMLLARVDRIWRAVAQIEGLEHEHALADIGNLQQIRGHDGAAGDRGLDRLDQAGMGQNVEADELCEFRVEGFQELDRHGYGPVSGARERPVRATFGYLKLGKAAVAHTLFETRALLRRDHEDLGDDSDVRVGIQEFPRQGGELIGPEIVARVMQADQRGQDRFRASETMGEITLNALDALPEGAFGKAEIDPYRQRSQGCAGDTG